MRKGEVLFENLGVAALQQKFTNVNYSKIVVLADANTAKMCLPLFKKWFTVPIDGVIIIKPGEEHKNIATCLTVWEKLTLIGVDRKSLLLNIGGGVVTDLGGFVAATFKRGIRFINIPTTLLAMVDASVGGKTGVDLGSLKNQIGLIIPPEMVLICHEFLKTLDDRQLKSGYAEMFKHALIANKKLWQPLKENFPQTGLEAIKDSIAVKEEIVSQDIFEQRERKKLNFGHTLGHAIESYFLDNVSKSLVLHGEAIAAGMVMEAFVSYKVSGLSRIELNDISSTLLDCYPKLRIDKDEVSAILELLRHDKKNSHGSINFTLLQDIGKAVVDCTVNNEVLLDAITYYTEF